MPRKGENINKRKDGRREARYIHHCQNGKAVYRYIYGSSYREARIKRQEEMAKTEAVRIPAVKKLETVKEIADL